MKVLASPAFAMQPPTRNVSAATPARATATPPTPASSARSGWLSFNKVAEPSATVPAFMAKLGELNLSGAFMALIEELAGQLGKNSKKHLDLSGNNLYLIEAGLTHVDPQGIQKRLPRQETVLTIENISNYLQIAQ